MVARDSSDMPLTVNFAGEGLGEYFDESVRAVVINPRRTTVASLVLDTQQRYPKLCDPELLCFTSGKDQAELIGARTVDSYREGSDQECLDVTVRHRMMALQVTYLKNSGDVSHERHERHERHIAMIKSNSLVSDLCQELALPSRNAWCSLGQNDIRVYGPGCKELSHSRCLRDTGAFEEGSGGVLVVARSESEGGAQGKEYAEQVGKLRKWANVAGFSVTSDSFVGDYKEMFARFQQAIEADVQAASPSEAADQEAGQVLHSVLSSVLEMRRDLCPEAIDIVVAALTEMKSLLHNTERVDVAKECVGILGPLLIELGALSDWDMCSYTRESLHGDFARASTSLEALISAQKTNTAMDPATSKKRLDEAEDLKEVFDELVKAWRRVDSFKPKQETVDKVSAQEGITASSLSSVRSMVVSEVSSLKKHSEHLQETRNSASSFYTEGMVVLKEAQAVVGAEIEVVEGSIDSVERQVKDLQELLAKKKEEKQKLEDKRRELERAEEGVKKVRSEFRTKRQESSRKCSVRILQGESALKAVGVLIGAAPLLAESIGTQLEKRVEHARTEKTKLAGDATVAFSARHKSLYLQYLGRDGALSFSKTKKAECERTVNRLTQPAMYDEDMKEEKTRAEVTTPQTLNPATY